MIDNQTMTPAESIEIELEATKGRLEAIVNALPDLLFVLDQHGTLLDFHSSAIADLYVSPEIFLGEKIADVLPVEATRVIMAALAEAVELGSHRGAVYSLVLPQGVKWFEMSIAGIPRGAGQERQFVALARDITRRKEAEDELRITRASFEVASDAIYWITPDARIVDVNPAACQMLGYTREEFLQLSIPDIDPHYDMQIWPEHFAQLRGLRSKRVETEHRTRDGHLIPVEIVVNHLDFGDREFHCSIVRDITQRRRAEERLVESEKRFWAFMDNGPVAAWIKDAEGRLLFLNRKFEQRFAARPIPLLAKTDFEIWPPQIAAQLRKNDLAVLESGEPIETTEEIIEPNGVRTIWQATKFPLRDAYGNQFVGGMAIDITERKKHESRLVEARQAAETACQAKINLFAALGEEIVTPLNAIAESAARLESSRLDSRQQEDLGIIKSSSLVLNEMLSDLHDFTSLEAGRVKLMPLAFGLRDILDEVLDRFAERFTAHGLTVDTEVAAGTPQQLFGDPLRFKQILCRLIDVPVRFTRQGRIRIDVCARPLEHNELLLQVAIEDAGIGISPAELTTVFQPFAHLSGDDGRHPGGTGLGLAICERLATLMGGRVRAQSLQGGGGSFFVELPFKVPTAGQQRRESPGTPMIPPRRVGPQLKVLLVDDDETNVLLLAKAMKLFGFTIVDARSGEEAVRKCAEELFDVVLMDLEMPGMDGIEALREIRAAETVRAVRQPVLAVEVRPLAGRCQELLAAGFDGCVAKPYKLATLLEEISRCSGERHAQRQEEG